LNSSVGLAVRPGDVIDGAYVVERLLGQGGMGAVYVAREDRLSRRVAIKVLSEAHGSNPEALARFEREARSAAALQSDHAARVFSVGHLANKSPYIVMELLEGEDLAGLLARRGLLPPSEVISMMLQVCDALAEAHALGIVHRDLKPANIFVAKRPSGATTIKVLDFGISKGLSTGATVSPLTATKAVMGTPLYMSPEQVRDVRAVDARTDVFSLGGVMYELLTGLTPFHAETLPDVFQKILEATPRPINETRPDVSPAFAALVQRCLEKNLAARFASAGELAQALSAVAASAPAPAPPAPQGSSAAETIAAQARNAYAQPIAPPPAAPPAPPTALPAHSAPPAMTAPVAARMPTPMPVHAPSMHTPPPMHSPSTGPTPPVNATPMPALAGTVDPLVFKTGSTTRAAAPSQPSIGLIVGVFFGVIAIVGVGVYLAVFRGSGDDKSAAASASASASALATATASTSASASAAAPASAAASATAPATATAAATAAATPTAAVAAAASDPAAGVATTARPAAPSTISALGKPPPAPSSPHASPAQPPPAASMHPLPPSQPPQHTQPGSANSGTLKIPSHRTD